MELAPAKKTMITLYHTATLSDSRLPPNDPGFLGKDCPARAREQRSDPQCGRRQGRHNPEESCATEPFWLIDAAAWWLTYMVVVKDET